MRRLRVLVPALWVGLLLGVALIGTSAPFALLAPAEAGRVASRMLQHEAYSSLVLAIAALLLERRVGAPALGANVLLALGAMFCTVVGYFVLQPLIAAARAGPGALTFGQLHGLSVAFFVVKLLLVCALAWRVSAAARPS